jgi:hypothetical protein
MLTVIESPEFIVWSTKVWSDDERDEFIDWISENPMVGDVIPGAGPLRKVRWSTLRPNLTTCGLSSW